jgi:DNA-binding NarL/FixJ family response regulator
MESAVVARKPIRLLVAVAVRLYRDGLATALAAHPHLRIDGTTATPLETRRALRDLQPDVVIVDVSFEDIVSVIRTLRAESSRSRILVFAVEENIDTILSYASAGADGFVTANSSVAELVEAIERTAAGELLCSARIAAQLLRQAARPPDGLTSHAIDHVLTGREQQVFSLLKQGRSNKEIARELTIAHATVKNHVHRVLEKLNVTTRGRAAAVGLPPVNAPLSNRSSRRPG